MEEASRPAWRAAFQLRYLRRLTAELRRTKIERRSTSASVRARAVKSAADLSLAMAARVRSARSRAIILARSGKTPLRKVKRSARQRRILKPGRNFHFHLKSLRRSTSDVESRPCNSKCDRRFFREAASRTSGRSHCEEEQSVRSRIETLKALVPGSRGLDTPLLLEEVADYIIALKVQVESMQTLADQLENSSSSCRS